MLPTAQFVFSLRSPYAWIAARWVLPQLPTEFELEWRPFFPLSTFSNFPPLSKAKTQYLVRDVRRLVAHHGGELRFPSRDDPNWAAVHAAFLAADAQGRGPAFALAVWEARFGRGEHVGDDAVLAAAAESVGLDGNEIVAASASEESQAALVAQVKSDYDERGIFGVPTLILPRGTRLWGHDRIEWAIREGQITA